MWDRSKNRRKVQEGVDHDQKFYTSRCAFASIFNIKLKTERINAGINIYGRDGLASQ